jgi:hypothetical protein
VEAELAQGHVDLERLAPASLGNLLGKSLELPVQLGAAAALLLLGLELVLIAVPVLALPVASLIELDVCRLSVELNILRFLLVADDDGVLQVNVNDYNQLVIAGLEEDVPDVGEQDVDTLLRAER